MTFVDPLADFRSRRALEESDAIERRRRKLAEQTATANDPGTRLRVWESLHALSLPRDERHPLVGVIARDTGLTLESVRDDAIFAFSTNQTGAQEAINLESEVPGIVQRGTPDASGAGAITFVDLRNTNLRQIASKSLDFTLEQRLDNVLGGRLVLTAIATRNISFKVQASNTGPAVEQVRNVTGSFYSRQIEWNGNAQVRWEGPRWSVGWSTRYFDYILVQQPTTNPTLHTVLQGSDRAPRAFSHDLNVNYRAPAVQNPRGLQSLLAGTSLTFGVKDVFDRTPRFWAPANNRGVAPYDSIMGRSVWMRMTKDFGE